MNRTVFAALGCCLAACVPGTLETPESDRSVQAGADGAIGGTPGAGGGDPSNGARDPIVTPDDPTAPDCQVDELPKARLRRLTDVEYRNTVVAALGDVFPAEAFPRFGDDLPTIGLASDPDRLTLDAVNVDGVVDGAAALAQTSLMAVPDVQACVAAQGDACFDGLIDDLVPVLWRRPVTDDDRTLLREELNFVASGGGTREQQMEFLLQALLLSPHMLFRTELGTDLRPGELSQHELAASLSYVLWNAPPDAELRSAADRGVLLEPGELRAQAERLVADPRFAEAMAAFYMDLLKIDGVMTKEKDGSFGLTAELRRSLRDGAERDLLQAFTESPDLFAPMDLTSFHVNATSAAVFGVDASGEELVPVPAPGGERQGILSHPAFLTSHSDELSSGIVKRGVFTLEQLLCFHLGAPPADISPLDELPPDFDPETASSRELLEVQHSSQPTCASCHSVIDPAGYGYENYDGIGRYRTMERGSIPIDASGELFAHGEVLEFSDSTTFLNALRGSSALKQCVVRHFLDHAFGDETDPCEAERVTDAMEGESLVDLVRAWVGTESFGRRAPAEDDR